MLVEIRVPPRIGEQQQRNSAVGMRRSHGVDVAAAARTVLEPVRTAAFP